MASIKRAPDSGRLHPASRQPRWRSAEQRLDDVAAECPGTREAAPTPVHLPDRRVLPSRQSWALRAVTRTSCSLPQHIGFLSRRAHVTLMPRKPRKLRSPRAPSPSRMPDRAYLRSRAASDQVHIDVPESLARCVARPLAGKRRRRRAGSPPTYLEPISDGGDVGAAASELSEFRRRRGIGLAMVVEQRLRQYGAMASTRLVVVGRAEVVTSVSAAEGGGCG